MKSLRIAMAGVALPVALVAQQPAASQANWITTAFKARIAQWTFGSIAQHVVSDSYLFCSNLGAMKPTIDATDTSTPDSVKATWPKAELVSKSERYAPADGAADAGARRKFVSDSSKRSHERSGSRYARDGPSTGDHLDFDFRIQRQRGHGDRGASWIRSDEVSGIYLVHLGESLYVHEIDIHLHDVGERLVRCLENHFEVAEDLLRLGGDAALDEFSRGRVLRDLTARIHAVAIANGR